MSHTLLFHSVTLPQSIESEVDTLHQLDPSYSVEGQGKKLKNSKFIFHILYYEVGRGSKKGPQLKRRRLVLGKKAVKDVTDGQSTVNPLILKSMRTRNKELLINSKDFNVDRIKKEGGFLGKKFWTANLLWGGCDSLNENLAQTAKLIKNQFIFADAKVVQTIRTSKNKKYFTKKPLPSDIPVPASSPDSSSLV